MSNSEAKEPMIDLTGPTPPAETTLADIRKRVQEDTFRMTVYITGILDLELALLITSYACDACTRLAMTKGVPVYCNSCAKHPGNEYNAMKQFVRTALRFDLEANRMWCSIGRAMQSFHDRITPLVADMYKSLRDITEGGEASQPFLDLIIDPLKRPDNHITDIEDKNYEGCLPLEYIAERCFKLSRANVDQDSQTVYAPRSIENITANTLTGFIHLLPGVWNSLRRHKNTNKKYISTINSEEMNLRIQDSAARYDPRLNGCLANNLIRNSNIPPLPLSFTDKRRIRFAEQVRNKEVPLPHGSIFDTYDFSGKRSKYPRDDIGIYEQRIKCKKRRLNYIKKHRIE